MTSQNNALHRRLRGIAIMAIIAACWVLVFARAMPQRDGDRGVFASMAERLIAGDRLYIDVWDNKEPLFYQTLALGRLLSPYMDAVLEVVWLAAVALAAWQIARHFAVGRGMSLLVGLGLAPVIATGGAYIAGFTHLPATAVLLGSYALLLRRHAVLAGALVAVLIGFKVVVLPLAFALIGVHLWHTRSRAEFLRLVVGFAGGFFALALLLALRGELVGFLQLLVSNVSYSQSGISDAYDVPVLKHLEPVMKDYNVATTAAIVVALSLVRALRPRQAPELWQATLWSLLAALLVVLATGLWWHHGQILYPVAILALVLVCAAFPRLRTPSGGGIVLAVALAIVLSGTPSLRDYVDAGLSAPSRLRDLTRVTASAQDLRAIASSGTYARLGENTDDTHAYGLREFSLRCNQFLQYPYDRPAALASIPACLPTVDYLLVDHSLLPEDGQDRWNAFVAASEAAIAQHFTCEARAWGRLCVNRDLSSAAQ